MEIDQTVHSVMTKVFVTIAVIYAMEASSTFTSVIKMVISVSVHRVTTVISVNTKVKESFSSWDYFRLIDDDESQEVNSYEQFVPVAAQYCGKIFEIYLLYSIRLKNVSKNYSVRVDAYNKTSLAYIAS
jgi:hypothetical protein